MHLMAPFHYTVLARLDSVQVPGTTFSITRKYLLNVGGVVIARLCKTAATLFYMRHKHINNGGLGGSGVLAAVCCQYLKMPGLILVWDGS